MAVKTVDLGKVVGDKGDSGVFYATSSTAAATAAKVATTTDGDFTLTTGAAVAVKFTNKNTATAPTLNVDSTGAKTITMYGTTSPNTALWTAGGVVTLVYDGTNWIITGAVGDTLPIARGGTGNTTGLAASATKLATARTIQTNLASTSTASFDGTANITPGVTGVLPVANGGTGYTTLTDTTYTTARYRASTLQSAETSPSTNGYINWTYE